MRQATFVFSQDQHVTEIPATTALEVDFPAAYLSEIGLKESWRKEVHRPATSTHKWWAKRLGSVFRGIIVSAVARNSDEAVGLYGSRTFLDGLVILDPFAGSGTTCVEALKLGARTVSFDINPVATLVQRQAVQTWHPAILRKAFVSVQSACRSEIDRVHRTEDGQTVLYYFWVATAKCPQCSETVRLFDSTVFSRNAYPERVSKAHLVCPHCLDIQEGVNDFEYATCANGHVFTQRGNVQRSVMTCRRGHAAKIMTALGEDRPGYDMYAKMVVDSQGRKTYEPITEWDRDLYTESETLLAELPEDAVLPVGSLARGNNTDQAIKWNFREWKHFFNARQMYSLSLIATAVRDVKAPAPEREALCALFSGTLEFNNLFASFKGEGTGAVRHMFSHHILKPERTPLEAHPWGTPYSSGSFSTLFKSRLQRAHEYKQAPVDLVERIGSIHRVSDISQPLESEIATSWEGFMKEASARAYIATLNAASTDLPDESVDLVVTDPPYMDNVHYAELADFFHVWLRQMYPFDGYPDLVTTRSEGEVQHADPTEFGKAIGAVWTECVRVLKPSGVVAFTFHQARMDGWVELIKSLLSSGLVVTAIQPVKGEMTTSIVKASSREPSNLDGVVVCRKAVARGEQVHRSSEEAYNQAVRSLSRLITYGVAVGAGDIRSVVRGSMLAYFAPMTDHLGSRALEVDALADKAIGQLLAVPSDPR